MASHDDRSSPVLSRQDIAIARFLVGAFLASIGFVPILEWAGGRGVDPEVLADAEPPHAVQAA